MGTGPPFPEAGPDTSKLPENFQYSQAVSANSAAPPHERVAASAAGTEAV